MNMMIVTTNTGNKMEIDTGDGMGRFVREVYDWSGSKIVVAKKLAEHYGIRYASAQRIVKQVLNGAAS